MNRLSTPEINVIALRKSGEVYCFMWSDENRDEILRTLGRFAATPELGFSWYDAALCAQKVRKTEAAT